MYTKTNKHTHTHTQNAHMLYTIFPCANHFFQLNFLPFGTKLDLWHDHYGYVRVCICVFQFKVLDNLTNFQSVWYKSYITEDHINVIFISCSQQSQEDGNSGLRGR